MIGNGRTLQKTRRKPCIGRQTRRMLVSRPRANHRRGTRHLSDGRLGFIDLSYGMPGTLSMDRVIKHGRQAPFAAAPRWTPACNDRRCKTSSPVDRRGFERLKARFFQFVVGLLTSVRALKNFARNICPEAS